VQLDSEAPVENVGSMLEIAEIEDQNLEATEGSQSHCDTPPVVSTHPDATPHGCTIRRDIEPLLLAAQREWIACSARARFVD
jgi:hypothetical protein